MIKKHNIRIMLAHQFCDFFCFTATNEIFGIGAGA